jgi:hypothetical protein
MSRKCRSEARCRLGAFEFVAGAETGKRLRRERLNLLPVDHLDLMAA